MSKKCPNCNKTFSEGRYCPQCGTELEKQNDYSNSSYNNDVPRNCVRDDYGHIRPDMEHERQIKESYKNRW